MPNKKFPFWASLLALCLVSFAAFGADNAASLTSSLLRLTFHLPSMFEGRGHHKAAFLVFATPVDVRSPSESIERSKILRQTGVTIDGFYLEAEHTGLNPETSRGFVTLAEQNGFRVLVRPPSLSTDSVKSWNSLGHSEATQGSLVQGASNRVGKALVQHPSVKAVGFTGSFRGGKALFDIAAKRPEPIPVYAEMGSTNPVFFLPNIL